MRPSSLDENREKKLVQLALAVILVILGVIGLSIILGSSGSGPKEGIHFSEIRLSEGEISTGESAYIIAQVANKGENDYEDVEIRLSTPSPNVKLSYKLENGGFITESEVGDEYHLTKSIPPLWAGKEWNVEESKKYAFKVKGNLDTGATSMTVNIGAQAMADGKPIENKVFELTITSETD